MRSLFDSEPAKAPEVKAFVERVEELKGYPCGAFENYWLAILADRVFILNKATFDCIMTTKLTLCEFWPEKVREMEKK